MDPPTEPSLPPGTISFSEIDDLKHIHYDRLKAINVDRFVPDDFMHTMTANEYLIDMHRQYLLYTASRFLCLRKVQIEDEYKAIPYVVRGSPGYTHRSKVRVHRIMDRWRDIRMPYATLITISPRATGSPYQRYLMMKVLWSKFANWLRSKDETKGNYIWCMEPSQRHYPHYHMILGRRIANEDHFRAEIVNWWYKHGVDIGQWGVDVQACRGSDQARAYALKYVSKGSSDPLWSAILWLSHGRIVGVSRPLGVSPLTNSQSYYLHTCCTAPQKIRGWDLIGVLPTVLMDLILRDRPPPDEIRRLSAEYLRGS